jgi:hypothetical protein
MVAVLILVIALSLAIAGCSTANPPANTGTTGTSTGDASSNATATPAGNPLLTAVQLSDIAPGLGVLMWQIGHRNWVMYYAANGGNWDLAAYQAKEMGEAIEVGATTRPKRKAGLDKFETESLAPLNAAITARDLGAFNSAWDAEVRAATSVTSTRDSSTSSGSFRPTRLTT